MAPPGALGRFQDDFARALLATDGTPPPTMTMLAGQPAFAVYRNTVTKACIDALQANFPAVNRLVGDEWMRAAAAVYARKFPPVLPMLLDYGADFADFLACFEPAAGLHYLPAIARLDRCWTESHVAADEEPLDAAGISRFAAADACLLRLKPHAAARWIWCEDAPARTIWARNRDAAQDKSEIDWRAEGALLTRPRDTVIWCAIDRAGCAFLDCCAAGGTMAEAVQTALDADGEADLPHLTIALLEAGAFSSIETAATLS